MGWNEETRKRLQYADQGDGALASLLLEDIADALAELDRRGERIKELEEALAKKPSGYVRGDGFFDHDGPI